MGEPEVSAEHRGCAAASGPAPGGGAGQSCPSTAVLRDPLLQVHEEQKGLFLSNSLPALKRAPALLV